MPPFWFRRTAPRSQSTRNSSSARGVGRDCKKLQYIKRCHVWPVRESPNERDASTPSLACRRKIPSARCHSNCPCGSSMHTSRSHPVCPGKHGCSIGYPGHCDESGLAPTSSSSTPSAARPTPIPLSSGYPIAFENTYGIIGPTCCGFVRHQNLSARAQLAIKQIQFA